MDSGVLSLEPVEVADKPLEEARHTAIVAKKIAEPAPAVPFFRQASIMDQPTNIEQEAVLPVVSVKPDAPERHRIDVNVVDLAQLLSYSMDAALDLLIEVADAFQFAERRFDDLVGRGVCA
jgi:hypothetical protein